MRALKGIDLLAMREYFSISFLNEMMSCSMRAVLGSVLRLPATREKSFLALLKGSIVHKALEFYFLTLKDKIFVNSSEELIKESLDKALMYFKNNDNKEKINEDTLISAIKYFENNEALIKVLANELELNYYQEARANDVIIEPEIVFERVPMFGHLFSGRIDLIFGRKMVDFKTVGQNISKDNAEKYMEKVNKLKADFSMQLLVYNQAINHLISVPPKTSKNREKKLQAPTSFEINQIVLTKNPKMEKFEFTKEEVWQAEEELQIRVNLVKYLLKERIITRNFKDTFCPCEYSSYCLDENKLKTVLSKINAPINIF